MNVGALFLGRLNDVRNAAPKDLKPSVSSPIELLASIRLRTIRIFLPLIWVKTCYIFYIGASWSVKRTS
jgi:hypothetical protein